MKYISEMLFFIIVFFATCIQAQIVFSVDSITIERNNNIDSDLEIQRQTPVINFNCSFINNTDSIIEFEFKDKQLSYYFEYEGYVYLSDIFVIDLFIIENHSLSPGSKFSFEFHSAVFEKEKNLYSNFHIREAYYEFLLKVLPSFKFRYISHNIYIESVGIKKIKFKD